MKTLLLSLFSTFAITGFADLTEKLGPDYHITKTAPSKALTAKEAMFIFTFIDPKGQIIKSDISSSQNKINKTLKSDATGKFILKVTPGKHIFQFFYNATYGEIYTDSIQIKPAHVTEINVYFRKANEAMIVDKPVIYVYSQHKEKVSIKLDLKGDFLFTYPEYKNGWSFTANPDGSIEMNDKKYHYLFWDGKLNIETAKLDLTEGFIVNKKDQVKFFEDKLAQMGLNSQEIEDYITYWCPRMSANEKNYIHFIFNETYNNYASINIDPKPDHLFRVCMLWSKAGNTEVKEQKIESFKRSGFTVVEWGGTEMNDKINFFK
ncbi:MAG: hypothetical protein H0U95_00920 [Bacteroidetes bacterium]|nr:hypothetical protein [Bacteroidota bacterium]